MPKTLYAREDKKIPGCPWDVVYYDPRIPGDRGVRVVWPGLATCEEACKKAREIARKDRRYR